jgi:hypothetical protein
MVMETRSKWAPVAVGVLILFLVNCNRGNQQSTEQPAAPSESTSKDAPKADERTLAHRPEAPARPRMEKITVAEGTTLEVRLANSISSGTATAGSEFEGTLAAPLAVNGVQVAPAGSAVTGKVSNVVSSGRLKRPAELALTLTSLTLADGNTAEISTSTWSQSAQSHKKRNAEMIGGGAGVGALIGAIAGKGKGAAIGAAIGGGAGTAGAAATGRKEIVLPAESKLTFSLAAPFTFTRKRA